MMATIEMVMDVTKTVKLKKDGIVKVDHQSDLALVFPSNPIDQSSQQQEQYIYMVKLYKVFDYLIFLLSLLRMIVHFVVNCYGLELSILRLFLEFVSCISLRANINSWQSSNSMDLWLFQCSQ